MIPKQDDPQLSLYLDELKLSGPSHTEALLLRASKKLKAEDLLTDRYAGSILSNELDKNSFMA
ncbi:MAG: hypothetical protein R2880_19040 [Deinococcales bacterium]